MNEKKIRELIEDKEFAKELFESKSFEEAQEKLKGKGLDMSIDEIKSALNAIKKLQEGELSDEALESVAGGSMSTPFRPSVAC